MFAHSEAALSEPVPPKWQLSRRSVGVSRLSLSTPANMLRALSGNARCAFAMALSGDMGEPKAAQKVATAGNAGTFGAVVRTALRIAWKCALYISAGVLRAWSLSP